MLLHAYLQGGAAADERNASWENEATLLTGETILGWSATERKDAEEAVRTAGQQPSHVVFPLECDGPATALFDATSGSVAFKLRLFQQCSGMPLLQRMKVEFLYGSVGENGDSKEQRQQYASSSSSCASSPTPARTRAPTRLIQMLPPPPRLPLCIQRRTKSERPTSSYKRKRSLYADRRCEVHGPLGSARPNSIGKKKETEEEVVFSSGISTPSPKKVGKAAAPAPKQPPRVHRAVAKPRRPRKRAF